MYLDANLMQKWPSQTITTLTLCSTYGPFLFAPNSCRNTGNTVARNVKHKNGSNVAEICENRGFNS